MSMYVIDKLEDETTDYTGCADCLSCLCFMTKHTCGAIVCQECDLHCWQCGSQL